MRRAGRLFRNSHGPWRPQRAIPTNRKAAALKQLLDYFQRQDQAVRELMRPDAALFKAWFNRAA